MTGELPACAGAGPLISRAGGAASGNDPVRYTIATLVNDPVHYEAMRLSFRSGGFGRDDCEFLYIDNTGDKQTCAYSGLNALLGAAAGRRIILCHQDVRLLTDTRDDLDVRLGELDRLDARWALAGNAGGVGPGELAIRITDPHGANQNIGSLPARVASLDENFIVVRREARVGFSADLSGFHFYGADICLNADVAGYAAYVIDFHLAHLSAGSKNQAFADMEVAFRAKWERALGARWVQTTCSLVRLSGAPLGQMAGRMVETPYARIARHLPQAKGWKTTSPCSTARSEK